MSQINTFPLRMMLVEVNQEFRLNRGKPALAFALLRKFEHQAELAIVVNNLRSLHDRVTSPYHFYEGWFAEPHTDTIVSVGVFNTDPDGKGVLLYRFDPSRVGGNPLSFYQKIFITAEPQDGNPFPATKVLG